MSNLEQERTIRNLNDSLDNIKEIDISLELKVREYIEKPNQENVGAAVATEEVNIEKEIMQIRANTTKLRKTNTVENEEENLEEHKDSTKPKEICRMFSQKGWCKYGTKCIYIHEERDDREQGKRTKICYHYSSKGFCRYGDEYATNARENEAQLGNVLPNSNNANPDGTSTSFPVVKTINIKKKSDIVVNKNDIRKDKKDTKKKTKRQKKNKKFYTNFRLYYVNCRGVKSKIESLKEIIEEEKPTVICLTETHIAEEDSIHLEGYHVEHLNRNSDGGGLIMAIKEELKGSSVIIEKIIEKDESMWMVINNNRIKVRIGLIYGPQESRTTTKEIETMYKRIEKQIIEAQ
eukprot:gene4143-4696_t